MAFDEKDTPKFLVDKCLSICDIENKNILLPFDTENSLFVKELKQQGANIKYGFRDFMEIDYYYDLLITNPPFSIKEKVFENFPKGLPLGFYISQWLANFVLGRVDALISRFKPVCFVRYVDDFIIADNNKQFLHGLIKKIAKCLGKLHLRLKKNYQVIRFVYEKKDGKKIGREIDFMGYYFDREHVILRKRVLIKATRTARRLKRLTVIGLRQAQGMLSRLGWFKHTQTKKAYLDYIQPNISIGSLKNIVRRNSRRMLRYENSVVRRTAWISAIAV